MRGEFLDIDGARIYYYAAGSRGAGEPVVLVHGFPTSGHLWTGVVPLIPEGHRVVVVDLLGFGRSDPPGQHPVTLRAHADRLARVLDQLGINFACVVGHDVGGGIAQSLALRYPHRVSRMCLIDSVAFDAWPARSVKVARAMLPLTRHLPPTWILSVVRSDLLRGYQDVDRGEHAVDLYLRPFATPAGRDALVAHLGALECSETQALAPRLKDVVCPVSIMWGERDPFLPVELGRRLAGSIPRSTLDVISGARHFLPEESPSEVAVAITRLLAR
ncbi:MAG TPA: alpha/beta hydrolase [Gemmatimonadaceae bacterium]|nr:alpha/beta hydrolase [Gemmatimonadaceae bacterium]